MQCPEDSTFSAFQAAPGFSATILDSSIFLVALSLVNCAHAQPPSGLCLPRVRVGRGGMGESKAWVCVSTGYT